jgi:hypothetical protein
MSRSLSGFRPSLYSVNIKAIVIIEKQYRSKNMLLKTRRKDYRIGKEEYRNSLKTLILKSIVLT